MFKSHFIKRMNSWLVLVLFSIIFLFHPSKCIIKNEIKERDIEITSDNLISAINDAKGLYKVPPNLVSSIDLTELCTTYFDSDGLSKFIIGRVDSGLLQMTLPTGSTVQQYISFMITNKHNHANLIECFNSRDADQVNKKLRFYFDKTTSFCDQTLFPANQHQQFIVNVGDLIKVFMNNFKIVFDKLYFVENIENASKIENLKEQIVMKDSYNDLIEFNCFAFIPKDKSIEEFIASSLETLADPSPYQFMGRILDFCEKVPSDKNKKVKWSEIMKEMSKYYFNPHSHPKYQKKAVESVSIKMNFSSLKEWIYAEVLAKIYIEFDNVVSRIKSSNSIDNILDLLRNTADLHYTHLGNDVDSDIRKVFTEIVFLSHQDYYLNNYNLLSIKSDKLNLVQVEIEDFNKIVKETLTKENIGFIVKYLSIPTTATNDLITVLPNRSLFLKLPFYEPSKLTDKAMVTDYTKFILSTITELPNSTFILDDFWIKAVSRETKEKYKKYLETKLFDLITIAPTDQPAQPELEDYNEIAKKEKETGYLPKQKSNFILILVIVIGSTITVCSVIGYSLYRSKKKKQINKRNLNPHSTVTFI